MKGQTFHIILEICVIFIIFIEYNDCYEIVPNKDEDKTNVTSDVEKVDQDSFIKLNKTILDIEAKESTFRQRNELTQYSEHVDKTNDDEELNELTNLITNICKEEYTSCRGREDEMNYFKETSPCIACSCNPILCQIAENCCPDVEPQSMDEEDIVLPVCMPMYDIIPKLRAEYNQKNHLEVTKKMGNTQNMELQQGRNFEILEKILAKNNFVTKKSLTPNNQNAIYGSPQKRLSTEIQNNEPIETVKSYTDITNSGQEPKDNEKNAETLSTEPRPSTGKVDNKNTKSNEHSDIINDIRDTIRHASFETNAVSENSVAEKKAIDQDTEINDKDEIDTTSLNEHHEIKPNNSNYSKEKQKRSTGINDIDKENNNKGTDDAKTEYENKDRHENITRNSNIREYNEDHINNSQTHHKDSNQQQTMGFSSDVVASNQDTEKTYISRSGNNVALNSTKPELEFPKTLVIDRCPKDFLGDKDVVELCEKINSTQLMDYVPIYQNTNNLVYRNRWCAKCNKAYWTQNWILVTDCMHMYDHYKLPSDLDNFLKLCTNCTGYFVPQKGMGTLQTCSVKPNTDTKLVIIDKCNITGHWENNERLVLELCERRNYLPAYQDSRREKSRIVYKNIFCFTCNTRKYSTATVYGKEIMENHPASMVGENKIYMNVNIEKENKFVRTDTHQDITCPNNYIPDLYNNGCILFKCPIYQTEIANFCVEKDSYTTGLVLTATLSVTFQDGPIRFKHNDAEISKYGQDLNSVLDKKLLFTKNGCKIVFVRIQANYTNIKTEMVDTLYIKYKIANTETCSVLTIVSIFFELVSTNEKTTIPYENKNLTAPFDGVTNISNTTSIGLEFRSLYNMQISKTLINIPISYEYELLETFNCPSVLLNMTYYKQQVEIKALLPLSPNSLDSTYTQRTGLVPICYNMYESQWFRSQSKQISVTQNSSLNKLDFLSTIISMASIIMVLITYFLFPDLRYVPGKLFMMLCFNLFIAQGLFTFGSVIGEDNGWCQFIGILIHLFWLATIFSMNSNLILLFRNLQNPLEASSRETLQSRSNSTVCRYIIYSYSMPIFCIFINITVSHSLFHDDHYGYGGKLCYINTPIMRLITFTIPLIIVLMVNFGLFTRIICNISQTMYKRYHFVFKTTIQMILKLSTITGVFWLFGFLYEATGISLFEYIFVILNAGQGFFLMTSFILNKRVLLLYQSKVQTYWRKKEDSLESTI